MQLWNPAQAACPLRSSTPRLSNLQRTPDFRECVSFCRLCLILDQTCGIVSGRMPKIWNKEVFLMNTSIFENIESNVELQAKSEPLEVKTEQELTNDSEIQQLLDDDLLALLSDDSDNSSAE